MLWCVDGNWLDLYLKGRVEQAKAIADSGYEMNLIEFAYGGLPTHMVQQLRSSFFV